MRCTVCDNVIPEGDVRWGYDEPYCEDCFDNSFRICTRCDCTIYRDNAQYDNNGDPYCDDCYDNEFDYEAPVNPDVDDSDREYIITLSRDWLQGRVDNKTFIYVNENDSLLKEIRNETGKVDSPVYVYGLLDRDEYQITATPDIIEETKKFVNARLTNVTVLQREGKRKIGVSLNLRQYQRKVIINLLKELTKTEQLAAV